MGKKRQLSPSPSHPDLSWKQARLDSFFLPTQVVSSSAPPLLQQCSPTQRFEVCQGEPVSLSSESSTVSPPRDLPTSPPPFDATAMLQEHSRLTAATVFRIFSQLALISKSLQELQQLVAARLPQTSALPSVPVTSQQTAPSSDSPLIIKRSNPQLSTQLVLNPLSAVISVFPSDDFKGHPDWSHRLKAKRHLGNLLHLPPHTIDLIKVSVLSHSCQFSRYLLEFKSSSVPKRLFFSASSLSKWGIIPHRHFNNLRVLKIMGKTNKLSTPLPPHIDNPSSSNVAPLSLLFAPLCPSPSSVALPLSSCPIPNFDASLSCAKLSNVLSNDALGGHISSLISQKNAQPNSSTQEQPCTMSVSHSKNQIVLPQPPNPSESPLSMPCYPSSPTCIVQKSSLSDPFVLVDALSQIPPPIYYDFTCRTNGIASSHISPLPKSHFPSPTLSLSDSDCPLLNPVPSSLPSTSNLIHLDSPSAPSNSE